MRRAYAVRSLLTQVNRIRLQRLTSEFPRSLTSVARNDVRSGLLAISSRDSQLLASCSRLDYEQRAYYSNPAPKNFLNSLVDNIKDELQKNKELQEQKKKLNERMKELNDSEALRDARKKFDVVEKETLKSSEVIRQRLEEVGSHINKMVTEIQKTEAGRKLTDASVAALRQAKAAADELGKVAEKVAETEVYQHIEKTAKAAQKELDDITDVRMYSRPAELKKRTDGFSSQFARRDVEVNESAQDVQLHKSSRWQDNWSDYMNQSSAFQRIRDMKMRFDESENVFVRVVRSVTDRVQESLLSSGSTEISQVLSEIVKVDPSFDKIAWLRFCEKEVIPNVLEAWMRADFDVLQDWCTEKAFNQFAQPLKENQKIGFTMTGSRVVDVSKVELVSGKMVDQGPVLVITFQSYMIQVVKNADGKVVEGNPDRAIRYMNVWALCRDMEEFNPAAAWKVLEAMMVAQPLSV